MTLEGTNTYLLGSDPCLVIDPGPADQSHIEAIRAAAQERGGIDRSLVFFERSLPLNGIVASQVEARLVHLQVCQDTPGTFRRVA